MEHEVWRGEKLWESRQREGGGEEKRKLDKLQKPGKKGEKLGPTALGKKVFLERKSNKIWEKRFQYGRDNKKEER